MAVQKNCIVFFVFKDNFCNYARTSFNQQLKYSQQQI